MFASTPHTGRNANLISWPGAPARSCAQLAVLGVRDISTRAASGLARAPPDR